MSEPAPTPAGGIVRARRYVSAPAGTYPAPVPPRPAVARGQAPPFPGEEPPAAPLPEPAPAEAAHVAAPILPANEPAAAPARTGWGGLLLGMLVGAVVGSSAGLLLVAFFGGCEPSLAWTDPLAVWRTVSDPVIRFSGILVAVGCALLGAALGGRRPASPPED